MVFSAVSDFLRVSDLSLDSNFVAVLDFVVVMSETEWRWC